jgi:Tfp pilus assembly protein PilE
MKKGILIVAVLAGLVASLPTQAQTTSSEGNAANSAQSKNGHVKEQKTEPGKNRAGVSRNVTGVRPDSNSTSNKFGRSGKQASRDARSPSSADGKVSKKNTSKSYPKAKDDRSNGRTFGNTGSDTNVKKPNQ